MKALSPKSCDTKPDGGFLSEDGELASQGYIDILLPPRMNGLIAMISSNIYAALPNFQGTFPHFELFHPLPFALPDPRGEGAGQPPCRPCCQLRS